LLWDYFCNQIDNLKSWLSRFLVERSKNHKKAELIESMPSEKPTKKLPSVKISTQANTSRDIVLLSDMKLFKCGFD